MNQGAAFHTRDGNSVQAMDFGMLSFLSRFFRVFHCIVLKQQKVSLVFTSLTQINVGIIIVPGGIKDREVWGSKTCIIIRYLKSQNKITFIQVYGTRCYFFPSYITVSILVQTLIFWFFFSLLFWGKGLLKVTNILVYNYGVLHFPSNPENMTALVMLEFQAVLSKIALLRGW